MPTDLERLHLPATTVPQAEGVLHTIFLCHGSGVSVITSTGERWDCDEVQVQGHVHVMPGVIATGAPLRLFGAKQVEVVP